MTAKPKPLKPVKRWAVVDPDGNIVTVDKHGKLFINEAVARALAGNYGFINKGYTIRRVTITFDKEEK